MFDHLSSHPQLRNLLCNISRQWCYVVDVDCKHSDLVIVLCEFLQILLLDIVKPISILIVVKPSENFTDWTNHGTHSMLNSWTPFVLELHCAFLDHFHFVECSFCRHCKRRKTLQQSLASLNSLRARPRLAIY